MDDGFYVFGGNRHVKGGKPLNFEDLWKFSIAANAWAEVKPVGGLPGSRGHHSLLALSPHAILLYGGALCNPGCKCYGDTWLFSATEAKWTFLNATDAPMGRTLLPGARILPSNWLSTFGLCSSPPDSRVP